MGFETLKVAPELVKILSNRNILVPTDIQSKTFPAAANGHDIIGVSQTGSGKTLAFLLPILQQTILTDKPFFTLILAPTRELCLQIFQTLQIFDSLNIRSALLLGGDNFNLQVSDINKKPHIAIGTPGRVVKHIDKTKNFKIERFRKLVFDEADRFFEMDFVLDLETILKKMSKKNQTLMFTASLTEKTKSLAGIFMRSPKIYGNYEITENVSTISESFALVPEKYKLTVLYNFLKERENVSTIVFVALCSDSQKISLTLEKLGILCRCLHGKMSQDKRKETISKFRAEEFSVLISTDLAGRGLDIPHVEMVVNYDLPNCAKNYTHRIGRTGRAGKDGSAISFVTQYDVESVQRLEHSLKRRLSTLDLKNYSDYDLVKEHYEEINYEFNQNKQFRH